MRNFVAGIRFWASNQLLQSMLFVSVSSLALLSWASGFLAGESRWELAAVITIAVSGLLGASLGWQLRQTLPLAPVYCSGNQQRGLVGSFLALGGGLTVLLLSALSIHPSFLNEPQIIALAAAGFLQFAVFALSGFLAVYLGRLPARNQGRVGGSMVLSMLCALSPQYLLGLWSEGDAPIKQILDGYPIATMLGSLLVGTFAARGLFSPRIVRALIARRKDRTESSKLFREGGYLNSIPLPDSDDGWLRRKIRTATLQTAQSCGPTTAAGYCCMKLYEMICRVDPQYHLTLLLWYVVALALPLFFQDTDASAQRTFWSAVTSFGPTLFLLSSLGIIFQLGIVLTFPLFAPVPRGAKFSGTLLAAFALTVFATLFPTIPALALPFMVPASVMPADWSYGWGIVSLILLVFSLAPLACASNLISRWLRVLGFALTGVVQSLSFIQGLGLFPRVLILVPLIINWGALYLLLRRRFLLGVNGFSKRGCEV